jgi:aminopeptidase
MFDARVRKQAEILLEHSLRVKKGEKIVIFADIIAKPLVLELYRLLIQRKTLDVRIHFTSYEIGELFYKYSSNEQINYFPKLEMDEMKYVDCSIFVLSSTNTRAMTGVDAAKISQRMKVTKPIADRRVEKTRWVITCFPTDAQAQEADMPLGDYENFVFNAINKVDWKSLYREQEKLRKLMDKTKTVHIVGEGTDLKLSISGRRAENCAGEFNMPDGEVFTSVVEDSAEGHIRYTYPAIYMGREFNNVQLVFKKGKVVKASATKNEDDLNKILDIDRGARRIGELGIGNNFQIKRFTKYILFDEKIGGSIHIALGRGYKETLSKNVSALHWDMIKDLRGGLGSTKQGVGGELFFDNKLVQKDGKWLI